MKVVHICFLILVYSHVSLGQIPAYTEFKNRTGTVITEKVIQVDTLGLRCYGGNYRGNDTYVPCMKIMLSDERSNEELMVYLIGEEESRDTPYIMFAPEEVDLLVRLFKHEIKSPLVTKSYKTLDPNGLTITVDHTGTHVKSLVSTSYIQHENDCLFKKETWVQLIEVLKRM